MVLCNLSVGDFPQGYFIHAAIKGNRGNAKKPRGSCCKGCARLAEAVQIVVACYHCKDDETYRLSEDRRAIYTLDPIGSLLIKVQGVRLTYVNLTGVAA